VPESMRLEKDTLGELPVPADAYYGIETMRALKNFPISGLRTDPAMIEAVMRIKKAAAAANAAAGRLDPEKAL